MYTSEMWNFIVQSVLMCIPVLQICHGFNFNLCAYFIRGGHCETSCGHEALHAWGIPLCMHTGAAGAKCCIPENHPLLQRRRNITTTPVPTTIASITTQEGATCGRARSHSRVRRVIGGNRAPAGTWPWQAALRLYTGQYVCGAVVISDNWVLTAAHCLQSPDSDLNYFRVYVGDQTLSYGSEGRSKSKAIRRIVRHEDFQQNVGITVTDQDTGESTVIRRHLHDIALVQLNDSLSFSSSVQPVCLPDISGESSQQHDVTSCWVAGWGENQENTYRSTDTLYEVEGEVLNHQQCGRQWGTVFQDDIVCFRSEGRGPCQGDSGGGMVCRRTDGRFSLVGIISWGREDCVHHEHPSVLTKVSTYRDWIDSHIRSPDV